MNQRMRLILTVLLAAAFAFAGCKPAVSNPAQAETAEPVVMGPAAPSAVPASPTTEVSYEQLREDAVCSALFIRAGKADAALVQAGDTNYLIDTGEKSSVVQVLAALRLMGVTRLDGVFLTHTHSDHIGGFAELAQEIPVARVYRAAFSENKKDGSNKIDNLAAEAGVPVTTLRAGDSVPLSGDMVFEVLGPVEYNADDDNDNSLVLRLTAAGQTLLFTGDMQFAEEESLSKAGVDFAADVLKVGNHGNPDATGDAFGAAVGPRYAVISTDRSVDPDSANPRVYAALGDAEIFVTDEFHTGVLAAVLGDGSIRLCDPQRDADLSLSIVGIDRGDQTVTIRNDGTTADISGCMLFSQRGGELFRFPANTQLGAGETVTVSGEGGAGDFQWRGEKKPWSTKKDDAALLYDSFGNVLARFD